MANDIYANVNRAPLTIDEFPDNPGTFGSALKLLKDAKQILSVTWVSASTVTWASAHISVVIAMQQGRTCAICETLCKTSSWQTLTM